MRFFLPALLVVSTLTGCASHVLIPMEQRAELERELSGAAATRFLRLSFYVTPFFGDASKKLLSPVPSDEVRLLNHPNGQPVNPGPSERIVAAGTRVRIDKVEFPSAWVVTERVVYTPRTQPWVYVSVDGSPTPSAPLILVMRPQLKDRAEFEAELERYLVRDDPLAQAADWSEAVREAIRNKAVLLDMPALAIEMAWGYPERKKIVFEGAVKKEEWIYTGGKRAAYLSDGRLVRFQPER